MTCDLYETVMQQVLDVAGVRHFPAAELCRVGRTTKGKGGQIVALKAPPARLFKNIVDTALVADWLREQVGPLVVNSGYRDPDYNAAVGGASGSMHLYFNALDLSSPTVPAHKLADLAARHPNAQRMGIGRYSGFVHIDMRGYIGHLAPIRWPAELWRSAA